MELGSKQLLREVKLRDGVPEVCNFVGNRVSSEPELLPGLLAIIVSRLACVSTLWFVLGVVLALQFHNLYWPLVILTLHILLAVLREGVSLYRRKSVDRRWNRQHSLLWLGQKFHSTPSERLRVGNVILLNDGQRFPADVVLLATSDNEGRCHISQYEVTGESDLSLRQSVKETQRILPVVDSPSDFAFGRLNLVLKLNPPTQKSSFAGKMTIKTLPRASILDEKHFVPGGSVLRNTNWALAMSVYCGMESKMWLNFLNESRPASTFSKNLTRWTCYSTAFLLLLSSVLVLIQYFASHDRLTGEDFLLYVLSLNCELPVAMFIGLEVTEIMLLRKYAPKGSGVRFVNGISEDLARVSYVLMDKTGALTERKVGVALLAYQSDVFFKCDDKQQCASSVESTIRELSVSGKNELTFTDLEEVMQQGSDPAIRRLCECLSLCNTATPLPKGLYFSPTFEETAIVEFARSLGCILQHREDEYCEVEIFSNLLKYKVLASGNFDREVRRVRVLVQGEADTGATLYVKGRYEAVKELVMMEDDKRRSLEVRLGELERKGVRTVLLCYRRVEGQLMDHVQHRVHRARFSQTNVQWKLDLILKEIENELTFLAILGLSDVILPETKECMRQLRRSGVAPLILSNDSESSTLACAYALELINPETAVVRLKRVPPECCGDKLLSIAKTHVFRKHVFPDDTPQTYFQHAASFRWSDVALDSFDFALSIDGETLSVALKDKSARQLLMCLLCASSFTCFNRLLPSQKRDVTQLLQQRLRVRPVIVAVGDQGGNASMLSKADIGVGVAKEGKRSVSCDVEVNSFESVGKLLFAGRENYVLLSLTALLFLYSTTLLHMIQLAAMLSSDFTPLPLFSPDLLLLITAFCFLIPFLHSVTTRQSSPTDTVPEAYSRQISHSFSKRSIAKYLSLACMHALVLVLLITPAFFVRQASLVSLSEINITLILAIVLTVNQHSWWESRKATNVISSVVSVGALLAYYGLDDGDEDRRGVLLEFFRTPRLVISGICPALACSLLSYLFCNRLEYSKKTKVLPIVSQSFVHHIRRESLTLISICQAPNPQRPLDTAETADFDLLPSRMRFKSSSTESDYMAYFVLNNLVLIRLALLLTCTQLIVNLPKSGLEQDNEAIFEGVACGTAVVLLGSTWFGSPVVSLCKAYAVVFLAVMFGIDLATRSVRALGYFSVPVGLLLIIKENWMGSVGIAGFGFVLLCVDSAVNCALSAPTWESLSQTFGFVLVQALVSLTSMKVAHRCNSIARFQYQLFKETEQRMTQNESVLRFLLPDFVLRQVKDGLRYIADDSDSVTVIFCELCDFDAICASYSPGDLTEMLDDVFQQIDEMCACLGVAKIETVGKVYMACAGLSDFESDVASDVHAIPHAQRALELAFAILASFRTYHLQTGGTLKFKIGVHTGPVIAGVVGYHKPQFSLVGDTVNTASRMSTTIQTPNTIQISEATYQALRGVPIQCDFAALSVFVKGKGEQTAYIVSETNGAFARLRGRGSTSEDSCPMRMRGRPRNRSSVVTSLRESLEMQEAVDSSVNELDHTVPFLPCWRLRDQSENRFRADATGHKLKDIQLGLLAYISALAVIASVKVTQFSLYGEPMYLSAALLFFTSLAISVVLRVKLHDWIQRHWLQWALVVAHSLSATALCFDFSVFLAPDLTTVCLCFQLVLMYYCCGFFFRHSVMASVLVLGQWVVVSVHAGQWPYAAFGVAFGLQHCVYAYFSERKQRLFFSLSEVASLEIEKTERLLTQMLPVHAYEGLKLEEWVTDRLLRVTLLYADISGFTAWSSRHSPNEVIAQLTTIYTAFDKICVKLGVYKVHTIGDCYVAMSATNNGEQRDTVEECRRMLTFALEMVEVLKARSNRDLDMRIGLHCGNVVGSISGSKVVRYDIYGSDVLIANKMESSGVAGRINVSEDVKTVLESKYCEIEFLPHCDVPVAEIQRSVRCFFAGTAVRRSVR